MTQLGSMAIGLVWGWLLAEIRVRSWPALAAAGVASAAVLGLVHASAGARAAILAALAIAVATAVHLLWKRRLMRRDSTQGTS